jgi:hypothetical protein
VQAFALDEYGGRGFLSMAMAVRDASAFAAALQRSPDARSLGILAGERARDLARHWADAATALCAGTGAGTAAQRDAAALAPLAVFASWAADDDAAEATAEAPLFEGEFDLNGGEGGELELDSDVEDGGTTRNATRAWNALFLLCLD